MLQYIVAYVTTAVVFLAIDFVWLSQIATRFYFDRIGHLLMDKPNMVAAGGFYIMYVVGIVIFAVAPALRAESVLTAIGYGALFGFFTYATYDMTNYATLRGWPFLIVLIDVAWGTILSATAAVFGFHLTRMIMRAIA